MVVETNVEKKDIHITNHVLVESGFIRLALATVGETMSFACGGHCGVQCGEGIRDRPVVRREIVL